MDAKGNSFFFDYHDFTGSLEDKVFKATIAQSNNMLVMLYCLEQGQNHPVHIHVGEDKFLLVLEGSGYFQVGDEFKMAGPGTLIWAPASVPHGVVNNNTDRLVTLVVVSPSPGYG